MSRVAGAATLSLDTLAQREKQGRQETKADLSVLQGPAIPRVSEIQDGLNKLGFKLESYQESGPYYRIDKVTQENSGATFLCKSPLFRNQEAGELLAREASMANTLAATCPRNFLKAYIIQSGQPISVLTDYVPVSLQELINKKQVDINLALSCFFQAGEALCAMKANNIFHSDICPASFRLTADKDLKLVNLNIKDGSEQLATAKAIMGNADAPALTPGKSIDPGMRRYVAPELLEGKPANAKTNVFQLGALLYELLTGKPPLGSLENLGYCYSRLNPVIAKALSFNPDDRYADVKELMAAVSAVTSRDQGGYKVNLPPSNKDEELRKNFFKEFGQRLLSAGRVLSFLAMPLNYITVHRREWTRNPNLPTARHGGDFGERGLHGFSVVAYTAASTIGAICVMNDYAPQGMPWYVLPAAAVACNLGSIAYEMARSSLIAAKKK